MTRNMWDEYDHTDTEMDVYEQSCENCRNCHCPMALPETAESYMEKYGTREGFDTDEAEKKTKAVLKLRREDAVLRGGDPDWCIYWKA